MKKIIVLIALHFFFSCFSTMVYAQAGELDSTFGNGGIVTNDSAIFFCSAIQSDGKILVAGSSRSDLNPGLVIVRYNKNGSLDSSFSQDGFQFNSNMGFATAM